ncbi:unnamed protein product [Arabidopsis thaliana]|uniref:Uncharacterized protein n=4 Tax=Arabidopsis TaxID=3701 RepID=A0A178VQP2_ARATH|nr:uncharacterized protein AT2G34224 [Arabidopsis thaliana]KAG7638440.1 hypothetical protein ISN45_At02g028750 [Arabidopsis thaliana x Arabidopsis arenosa]KAG7643055.1 hypothetical protein ISN44_As02g028990 [Arabidopsis suecica]AEC08938.1 hypothetical protein AT2G34224 [Arabidopsis thaliana]OAP08126.1 hypothetical protein AXX17_AT2G30700 [Arabidopsis thaliana]CAA0374519.1 unnamed protein product [Arabidopsis thaliana]|eukprot:NP_001318349.1 hypothetical protein AT2G34224 [Arabidopsis thaliana]
MIIFQVRFFSSSLTVTNISYFFVSESFLDVITDEEVEKTEAEVRPRKRRSHCSNSV